MRLAAIDKTGGGVLIHVAQDGGGTALGNHCHRLMDFPVHHPSNDTYQFFALVQVNRLALKSNYLQHASYKTHAEGNFSEEYLETAFSTSVHEPVKIALKLEIHSLSASPVPYQTTMNHPEYRCIMSPICAWLQQKALLNDNHT